MITMIMNKIFKHYFIPHEGNAYRPHFFHNKSIIVVSLFAGFIFVITLGYSAILGRVNYLASVLPSVLIDLANEDRSLYDLLPLTRNPILEAAAKEKANDMARYSYFAHVSPTGITPWYWFVKNGYTFIYAGENLAVNFTDSGAVNQAWMNSAGHRANILNQQFSEIGIATVEGVYEGRPTIFVVQYFGRPTQVVSLPSPTTVPKLEPITETDTFIAVKNADAPEPVTSIQPPVSNVQSATQYATLPAKVFTSPKIMLRFIYLVLFFVILFAITLSLSIELKRHHAKHLVSGVFVVILLMGLTYLYQHITGSIVAII